MRRTPETQDSPPPPSAADGAKQGELTATIRGGFGPRMFPAVILKGLVP